MRVHESELFESAREHGEAILKEYYEIQQIYKEIAAKEDRIGDLQKAIWDTNKVIKDLRKQAQERTDKMFGV